MKIRVSMHLAARTGAGWQDTGDPGHDYYEANIRNNLLPQAIALLDRSDLVALFRLAEVLAAYPREEGFFAWYQRYQRERLAWYVEVGMLPAEVLER